MGRSFAAGAAVVLAAAAAGCGASGPSATRPTPSPRSTRVPPTPTVAPPGVPTSPPPTAAPTTSVPAGTAPASSAPATSAPPTAAPAFSAVAAPVTAAELGATWHGGCPVDPTQLRAVTLDYWGFDSAAHTGTIVVNQSVVSAVTEVFATLYADHFPIRQITPESAYGGDDNAAAAADDTSGFNCRYAVAPGPPQWSVHAYGEAIDVNDVENPYLDGATLIPPAGAAYADRSDVRAGMAVRGGTLVDAFSSVGWQWGGRWTGSPDYQHFSSTGG